MTLTLFERFRRNHALEHATMHLLARTRRPWRLMGRSDWGGFTMYGHVDTAMLACAAQAALVALQSGRADLAVHPRCGTNLAVNTLLAGGAYSIVSAASRRHRRGTVALLTCSMIAAVAALGQPLSRAAQAHLFTSPDLATTRITGVRRSTRRGVPIHRISVAHD